MGMDGLQCSAADFVLKALRLTQISRLDNAKLEKSPIYIKQNMSISKQKISFRHMNTYCRLNECAEKPKRRQMLYSLFKSDDNRKQLMIECTKMCSGNGWALVM